MTTRDPRAELADALHEALSTPTEPPSEPDGLPNNDGELERIEERLTMAIEVAKRESVTLHGFGEFLKESQR